MIDDIKKLGSPEEKTSFDDLSLRANFSSLLYLCAEQQALIGMLLSELLEMGFLNIHQLERITGVRMNREVLTSTYADVHKKYAYYFLKSKEVIKEMDEEARRAKENLNDEDEPKDKLK